MGKKIKKNIRYDLQLVKQALEIAEKLGWFEVKLISKKTFVTNVDGKERGECPILIFTGDSGGVGIYICPKVS